jgi:hypothetical protein
MLSLEPKGYPGDKFPESPSEQTLIPPDQPSQDSDQRTRGSNLDFSITSRTVHSSLLCAETTANISITCVNCKGYWERSWGGIILGRRAIGCIKALLFRNKLMHAKAPLIGLLTICKRCDEEKLRDPLDEKDQIRRSQGSYATPGKMIFRVSHKEMEELLFSKVVVFMGMFTTPFRTTGSDGYWKEWNLERVD